MPQAVLGAAIDFTGVTLPFTVNDLVGSANALLGIVGTFILLGLAFALAPRFFNLIRGAIQAARGK